MPHPPVNSAFEDIVWPALPDPRGAAVLAILYQLERSQWWAADRLVESQLRQASRLVRHARRSVPYYRRRLPALGPDEAIQLDRWREIPILQRNDIQKAADALIGTRLPEHHGQLTEIFTSGSTGRPVRTVRTQLWELFWSAFTIRDHLWHGRDMGLKLGTIRESGRGKAPYPTGARARSWGRSTGGVFKTGPSIGLNITSAVEEQVEWLTRERPAYLLTHPSMADRLARYCLDRNIGLDDLRQVLTISEILRPATREICHAAWDVPVVDLYSTRETGYLALQCPQSEVYHVQSESVLLEVLDPRDRPCSPGQIGRVVVTTLNNFAMPLIRYEIGDYAEVGGSCPCGRGLPVLTRILGRQQNMLILPSGEARWPLLSSHDIGRLLAIAPVEQYQFVQKSATSIELRLVVPAPLTNQQETAIRTWVQDKFDHLLAVDIAQLAEIPRSAQGKFQDFVSEIAAAKDA